MLYKWSGWQNNRTDIIDGEFKVSVITVVDKLDYEEKLGGCETIVCPLKNEINIIFKENEKISLKEKDCAAFQGLDSIKISLPKNSVFAICKGKKVQNEFVTKVELEKIQSIFSGNENYRRKVYVIFGPESPLQSLLMGLTVAEPGNWTTFPPHRHDDKPEVYIYYGLEDGFGIQLELSDKEQKAYVVNDYDAFLAKECYHPNTAPLPFQISYIWFIYAPTSSSKNFKANIHPKFKSIPSGPTIISKKT